MPMHRWMQSAAGGTSQRLKPAAAIVRSLSRIPPPAPDMVPALLIVVIRSSPAQPPLPDMSAVLDPVVQSPSADQHPRCCSAANLPDAPGSPGRIRKVSTPAPTRYAHKPLRTHKALCGLTSRMSDPAGQAGGTTQPPRLYGVR